MYKIGDTSGLCEAHCDEKKHTIKVVGDVIEKMAKKCEDVPKKMRAPAKVIEITNGCFSSAQLIAVSDEAASDNGEGAAAAQAASTGGGCGGGRTPKQPKCPGSGGCGKKSCCGGKKEKTRDPCSGQKLTDLVVPQTMQDFIASDYGDLLAAEQLSEHEFRNTYCINTPYPECATCPYNSKRLMTQDRDLGSIFRQMDEAIQTMLRGNYSLATKMFQCPAQMRMLMENTVRTMAEVALPNSIAAMIGIVAARGAIEAYKGIAMAAEYNDFRREVMYSAGRLFNAGGKVGIPRAFVDEVGLILRDIGCSPRTLTRLYSSCLSPYDTQYGPTYSLVGSRDCCGRNRPQPVYRSNTRRCASPYCASLADQALKTVRPCLSAARDNANNPPVVPKASTSTTKAYTSTGDTVAQPGKTYYKESTEPGVYIPVQIEANTPIDEVEAKFGPIYESVDTGVSLPDASETTSEVVESGKTYYFDDPATGRQIPVQTAVGETISNVKDRISDKYNIPAGNVKIVERKDPTAKVVVGYEPTTDTSVAPGKTYVRREGTGYVPVNAPVGTSIIDGKIGNVDVYTEKVEDPNVAYEPVNETAPIPNKEYYHYNQSGFLELMDTSGVDTFNEEVFVKVTIPIGTDPGAVVYTGTDTCVLDDGLIVEEPVFLDAASYVMAIDTQSLVTKTRVNAGEMASILDIGLSAYEIKMAYLLDHERNGSVLPDDVEGQLIPTILDEICDNA